MNARATRLAAAAALAAALAGCLPILEVRTRTRILPDGTALRETTIVKIRRDGSGDAEKEWNRRPIADDLGRALGEGFASVQKNDDRIVLSGVFADASKIPPDFRRDVPVLGRESTNRVSFQQQDLLLGTRYLYRERFVDAIEPDDQAEAKATLIRFGSKFVKDCVRHEFGAAYELAAFERWADRELEPALGKLVDIYWSERKAFGDVDPHTGKTGLDRALARARDRIAELGLDVDPARADADNLEAAKQFLCNLLAGTLQRKGDAGARPKADEFLYLFPEHDPGSGIAVAAERAAEREFGSVQEAKDAFQRAVIGVTGSYGSPPAEAEFRFDCAVELPGVLLRTNGAIEGDAGAFWLFEGEDLYPNGFLLEAESVVLDSPFIGRIAELKPSLDRRDAVRLIERLRDVDAAERARLRELLAQCAAAGSLAPLAPAPGATDAEKALAERLKSVLEVVLRES